MFVDDYIDLVLVIIFVYFDVMIEFFCEIVLKGLYLVIDLLILMLCIMDFCYLGEDYYCVVMMVK